MPTSIGTDRPIHGKDCPEGRLEIIEDVGIAAAHHRVALSAFTVPASFVSMSHHAVELWKMILQHAAMDGNTLFLCPGNGAWLMERALKSNDIHPAPVQPIDISRDSDSSFRIHGNPSGIVIIEDIVETGATARKFLEKLADVRCPVTLATMLWHDREAQTKQVFEVFSGYNQVLVSVRIRSHHEKDDVRSLSTLARKHKEPKNHRYSIGREREFMAAMQTVLDSHPWLDRLGLDLGYRRDEYSVKLHQDRMPSSD